MIVSFAHKGLRLFFEEGNKKGINADFAPRLLLQLTALDAATGPAAMGAPGWDLHSLKGDLAGFWAVKVSGNWRLVFRFSGENAEVVDLRDYH